MMGKAAITACREVHIFCHSCAKRENPEFLVSGFKNKNRNLWILGPSGQE
jgi:hypothetical protein